MHGSYHPHPWDCTKFYQCGPTAKKIEMNCAPGTVWNQNFKICDYRSNVKNCTSGTTRKTTKESTKCANGTYHPHLTDCTKYYQCGPSGKKVIRSCKLGKVWNQKIQICDHKANVDECNSGKRRRTTNEASECTNGMYYPHPSNCTKFYQCGPGAYSTKVQLQVTVYKLQDPFIKIKNGFP